VVVVVVVHAWSVGVVLVLGPKKLPGGKICSLTSG
jgi:hypothetical protein